MIEVIKNDYQNFKKSFFEKHDSDIRASETYPIGEHTYRKVIALYDGSVWTEIHTIASKNIDFLFSGKKITFTVDVVKIDFYSSDDNNIRFFYTGFVEPVLLI